jgi:hypothetical protein
MNVNLATKQMGQDWLIDGVDPLAKRDHGRPSCSLFYYLIHINLELQVYFWVIGSNFILRLAWTYKLSAHLRHNYLTVFTITALEMIRRFQWVFFRVENEWNKMSSKSNLQLSEISSEEDKLLAPNDHHV